jgi:hypothetical protein
MTTANKFPKISLNQIKDKMRAAGSHWWDADTMRHFGTIVKGGVYNGPGGAYFVTSDYTGFDRDARGYTIRHYDPAKNTIHTHGDGIASISDLHEAQATAARLAFGNDESAILGYSEESLTPATPRDDLRAALKRAGIECSDEQAARMMHHARKVQQACVDQCNIANYNAEPAKNAARRWLENHFPNLGAKIGGDPRGATFKLILPNGETNDFGKEGYIVPTSNSLDD